MTLTKPAIITVGSLVCPLVKNVQGHTKELSNLPPLVLKACSDSYLYNLGVPKWALGSHMLVLVRTNYVLIKVFTVYRTAIVVCNGFPMICWSW